MAKIHHAQAVCGRKKVFRRFADGHTEPADEDDVHEAFAVESTVITRRVVIQLGVMKDGKFVRLDKGDVPDLGTKGEPLDRKATSRIPVESR